MRLTTSLLPIGRALSVPSNIKVYTMKRLLLGTLSLFLLSIVTPEVQTASAGRVVKPAVKPGASKTKKIRVKAATETSRAKPGRASAKTTLVVRTPRTLTKFATTRLTANGLAGKQKSGALGKFVKSTMAKNRSQLKRALERAGLSPKIIKSADSALAQAGSKMAAQFGPNGPKSEGTAVQKQATTRIHAGYVASEVATHLGLSPKQAKTLRDGLIQHGPRPGLAGLSSKQLSSNITKIIKSVPSGKKAAARKFLKGNGWMLCEYGFGKVDVAKNQAAVLAGEALIKVTQKMGGTGRAEAISQIDKVVNMPAATFKKVFEGKSGTPSQQAIAQIALRTVNVAWFRAVAPQAAGEANAAVRSGNGASNKGAKRVADKNFTNFDQMAKNKGFVEVAKDLVQIKSYLHHLSM